MENLGVHLEAEEKDEFFEYVKDRLKSPRNDGLSVYDHLDTNSSVVWKHQNDVYSVVPFDLFSSLYSVAFESEPRYDLSELDQYLEKPSGEAPHMNDESLNQDESLDQRVQLKDGNSDVFSYVFHHFELGELADRFDRTEALFKNWRTGKTQTVDAEILREAAEEVKSFYDSPPEINPSLVDLKAYKGNSLEDSTIVEDGDLGALEVLFYRRGEEDLRETARMLEEGSSEQDVEFDLPRTRVAPVYPHLFNNILEKAEESGFVNSSKVDNIKTARAGHGFSYLEDLGLIESWGSGNNGVYTVEADKPEIYDTWRKIANSLKD